MEKQEVDEQFEKIQQQSAGYEAFEKQCQEVLDMLVQDDSLDTFRREYDTLFTQAPKTHEGERRMIKKCIELQAEIHTCRQKVKTAEELSQGDRNTIETLKKEIEKAKKRLESSKEKEVTAKENIKRLRMELKDLEKQVEKDVSGLVGHDSALQELQKVRDDLQKERDTQGTQLQAITTDIRRFELEMKDLLNEKNAQDDEIRKLKDVTVKFQEELEEQKVRKYNWEMKLKQLKNELQQHHGQIRKHDQIIFQSDMAITRLDEQLSEQKAQTEKAIKEYESINKTTQRYQRDLEQEIEKTSRVKSDNSQLQQQRADKDIEIKNQKQEQSKLTKQRDAAVNRKIHLEHERQEIEAKRNDLRLEISNLENEIASGRKASENDRKQIDDLTRERDILNKNFLKAQGSTDKVKNIIKIREGQRRNLEQELKGYEKFAEKQRKIIYDRVCETEQYEKDAEEALVKYDKAMEKVKILEQEVDAHLKDNQDSENREKQQEELLKQVREERNLYSKILLDNLHEIQEMKRKFRIMNHDIIQLKEEIQSKEKELVELNVEKTKKNNEWKLFKQKKNKFQNMIEANDRKIDQLGDEINKLNEIINEADSEKAKQRRDYENVMNERDILGAQLIKRNDELARLYERIRIQQSAMNKGEIQYRDRQLELRELNRKIHQLAEELEHVKDFTCKIDVLKTEINKATKDLTREQTKVRVLTDELRNPLNVHRWHKMEGSDPTTFEALNRIHDLQKQLILKTEEVEEKEKQIAEREKLYTELKTILQRQPGPEVAEQLNVYQDNLRKKNSQMKAMQASLAHFQEQVTRCQSQHDEINGELSRMRKDFFAKKKREEQDAARQAAIAQMVGGGGDSAAGKYDQPYTGHQVAPLDDGGGVVPGAEDTAGSEDPYKFDARAAAAAATAAAAGADGAQPPVAGADATPPAADTGGDASAAPPAADDASPAA